HPPGADIEFGDLADQDISGMFTFVAVTSISTWVSEHGVTVRVGSLFVRFRGEADITCPAASTGHRGLQASSSTEFSAGMGFYTVLWVLRAWSSPELSEFSGHRVRLTWTPVEENDGFARQKTLRQQGVEPLRTEICPKRRFAHSLAERIGSH